MSEDLRPPGAGSSPDGSEHDAWLREALRHAPDAAATPPVSLRDAILAEARAATRVAAVPQVAATPSLFDRALEFWSWLARPQVATGFASVMAATLVGMLWWDRPIDETMLPPPSSPPIAAAPAVPAQAQKPVPEAAARQDDASRPPVAPVAAPPMSRDAAPAPAQTPSPAAAPEADATTAARSRRQELLREGARDKAVSPTETKSRAATENERSQRKDRPAKLEAGPVPSTAPATTAAAAPAPVTAAAPAPPAGPTPFPARAPSDDDGATRRPAPVAAPRPAAPTPPPMEQAAPAAVAAQSGAAPGRAEPFAPAKKAESGEKESASAETRSAAPAPAVRSPAPTGALGRATLDSAESGTGGRIAAQNAADATARQRSALAASATRPMAPLLASLVSEEARWSRRLAGGESAAVDAAVRAWLTQVQTAAPRWEAVADRNARRDATASSTAATLVLERDGRTAAIVQIEDGGVLFDPVSGPASFAPLPAEVAARLRATLPPGTR